MKKIGGQIYIFGTTRARKAVEVTMEKARQDEFKSISFIQISLAVQEFRGRIFNFGTTKARKMVVVSLERSRRNFSNGTLIIEIGCSLLNPGGSLCAQSLDWAPPHLFYYLLIFMSQALSYV